MYATMGDQCLIKKSFIRGFYYNFFTEVTDLIMNKMYLCILTQDTIKCAFLRYKKIILFVLILSDNPNWFLDVKQYYSLEN